LAKTGFQRYLDGEKVFGEDWQVRVKKIYIWLLRYAYTGKKLVPINSKFAPE